MSAEKNKEELYDYDDIPDDVDVPFDEEVYAESRMIMRDFQSDIPYLMGEDPDEGWFSSDHRYDDETHNRVVWETGRSIRPDAELRANLVKMADRILFRDREGERSKGPSDEMMCYDHRVRGLEKQRASEEQYSTGVDAPTVDDDDIPF